MHYILLRWFAGGLLLHDAVAIVSVRPLNGGTLGTGTGASVNMMVEAVPFYYFVTYANGGVVAPTPSPPAFLMDAPLDISKTAATDTGSNALQFRVSTDYSVVTTGATNSVLVVQLIGENGASPVPVSIATVNGAPCNGSTCQNRSISLTPSRYYAAKMSGNQTIQIGLYPSDLCYDYQGGNTTASGSGCTGPVPSYPVSGSTAKMQLFFKFGTTPDSQATTVPSTTFIDTTPNPLNLIFQVDTATMSCPANVAQAYMPGDGQFFLDGHAFAMTTGSAAGPAKFYVLVNPGANAPVLNSSFQSENMLHITASFSETSNAIGPIANSTNQDLIAYNAAFIGQDLAGMYTPIVSCTISPIYASEILGFMTKSHCFVATAAFDDGDHLAVRMLRQFRDEYLESHIVGRFLVRQYESLSPPLAHWLMLQPAWVKVLVQIMLLPFVLLAMLIAGLVTCLQVTL